MSPLITLRPSTAEDEQFFYDVIDRTMRSFIVATWGAWNEARVRRGASDSCRRPYAQVVLVAGQEAGVLSVREEASHFQVDQIYLFPEHQRRGVGTELMQRVLDQAAAASKPVRLRVLKVNPARSFYEKLDFRVTAVDEDYTYMERAVRAH